MEDVYDWKGINGQIMTFKKEVVMLKRLLILDHRVYALLLPSYWLIL
ncbi:MULTISPECIES: hypothetical protein [Methanobrevibacter]|nr:MULTISPECIES: hypothetical protein [Methanobrevibacter]